MIRIYKTNVCAWNGMKSLADGCGVSYRVNQIDRGSFEKENTSRVQLTPIMLRIEEPLNFIYYPKDIPLGILKTYYNEYLINPQVADNEEYTYGERIMQQLETVLEMIRKTPNTNQASISISRPEDIHLKNPPCLREITFSYFSGNVHMTSFWRSNDIGEAFLINQGGLALLLQDVADYGGHEVGRHYYCSPGAHLYEFG